MSNPYADRQGFATVIKAAQAGIVFGAAVTNGGSLAINGKQAYGICLSPDPVSSGDHINVGYVGEFPFANTQLDVTSARALLSINASGRAVIADSGTYIVGRCLGTSIGNNANVNSAAIGVGLFNFLTPVYSPSSLGGAGITYYG